MRSFKLLALASALLVVGLSGTAFGVASYTTTSTVDLVAPNAQNGAVGSVVFSFITGTIAAPGDTVTVAFPAPITGPAPTVNGIPIGTTPTPIPPGGLSAFFSRSAGTVTLQFDGTATPPSITIAGVTQNVNATGLAPGSTLNATITNVTGQVSVTNPVLIVGAVRDPIALAFTTPPTVASFLTNQSVGSTSMAIVRVSELGAFTDAFETGASLIFTISNIPAGVVIDAATGATITSGSVTDPATADITPTAGTATLTTTISGATPTALDAVTLTIVFKVSSTPLPVGSADITVTLGPAAATALGDTLPNGPFAGPRFAVLNEPPLPGVLSVAPATSILLAPFAARTTIAPPFDTGFAVTNLSGGLGGTPAVSGNIRVRIWRQDGTLAADQTTGTGFRPGVGLDASGNLAAGATWAVLLSDILTALGLPAGTYAVRLDANFTPSSMFVFVSDFVNVSHGYLVSTLPLQP